MSKSEKLPEISSRSLKITFKRVPPEFDGSERDFLATLHDSPLLKKTTEWAESELIAQMLNIPTTDDFRRGFLLGMNAIPALCQHWASVAQGRDEQDKPVETVSMQGM